MILKQIQIAALAATFITGSAALAFAQSASTNIGAGVSTSGNAAAGGTSASTQGGRLNTSSSLSTSGTAAGGTKTTLRTKSNASKKNPMLATQARAQDRGIFSRSTTRTRMHKGVVTSRTKTMAHTPGSGVVKSRTSVSGQ